MTPAQLLAFLRRHRLAVEASVGPGGAPQAALVGFAVSDAFEIVFDTLTGSRKYRNLCADHRIALVVGWDEEITAQIEGVADFPGGDDLERVRECYFAVYPDGRERLAWPGITHVRVRPTWIRYSDYGTPTESIVEFSATKLVSGAQP
ncbi:MAG TPA: pyridoxamine 5'-phosphate oxidase family protein [Anaeromyxobacter sp.]|nr:pyridoxamine 5'-phosphate oxidase family protein [Anaeromyxobacter sp.]